MLVPMLVLAVLATAPPPTHVNWSAALDQIEALLAARHPDAFARVGRRQFSIEMDELRRDLPRLDDDVVTVRLMQLVASLQDGHTQLEPAGDPAFAWWFPVRFYAFPSGVYVTAIDRRHRAIAGAHVLRIGTRSADDALTRARSLMGADNRWGSRDNSFALSNATMLHALGITERAETLELEVETAGRKDTVRLDAVHTANGSFDGRFRGEMFPPFREDSIDWVTAFDGRAPRDFRIHDPRLPLHLRYRLHYFFTRVDGGLYAQINFMANADSQSFAAFTDSLFAALDREPARKFIIDLRYNSGGNGDLVSRFADALKARATSPPWRQVYVLLGPKTFSAAIMMAHGVVATVPDAVTVGEPSGAGFNSFGDPMDFPIAGTGLRLSVSTLYHQLARYDDFRPYIPINLAVEMTPADYFAGRDPVLALVQGGDDTRAITAILRGDGPAAAQEVFAARSARYGGFSWWEPFEERAVNSIGYERLARGDREGAAGTFALNTQAFPGSGNTWDSYGEALAALGRWPEARAAYERSLALNPGNASARTYLESHPVK
jgi:tetratricopeptide (TPR) repeat protein